MANKRQALGRGLEALFTGSERPLRDTGVLSVAIEQIIPNPRQPRTTMNAEQLADLAASPPGAIPPAHHQAGSQQYRQRGSLDRTR